MHSALACFLNELRQKAYSVKNMHFLQHILLAALTGWVTSKDGSKDHCFSLDEESYPHLKGKGASSLCTHIVGGWMVVLSN